MRRLGQKHDLLEIEILDLPFMLPNMHYQFMKIFPDEAISDSYANGLTDFCGVSSSRILRIVCQQIFLEFP